MIFDSEFKNIRPYIGDEVRAAVDRLIKVDEFFEIFTMLSKRSKDELFKRLNVVNSTEKFFTRFFRPVIEDITENTTSGITISGLNKLKKDKNYIFISNHRDIILDSSILNVILHENGFRLIQSAIGSNLLINSWVTDFVKLNSCFTIERNISGREMLISSALRSKYMRELITESNNSIWIAQREGRTKDGNDRTQQSILKMFRMSGSRDFAKNMAELNIVPVSISYEWEPCDDMKASELYLKTISEYRKTPEDDMKSMINGLAAFKGRIHYSICDPIEKYIDKTEEFDGLQAKADYLASCIDKEIYANFKLWENNYIAYDIKHSINKYEKYYTKDKRDFFIKTMQNKIDKLEGNRSFLNNIFLEIYSNPIKNQELLKI